MAWGLLASLGRSRSRTLGPSSLSAKDESTSMFALEALCPVLRLEIGPDGRYRSFLNLGESREGTPGNGFTFSAQSLGSTGERSRNGTGFRRGGCSQAMNWAAMRWAATP